MERLKRGDVVTVAAHSDYTEKPRPAVIVQSDLFNTTHASITLCLITSELRDLLPMDYADYVFKRPRRYPLAP
jgi:mRNA-degrading endonuclease toxin of MazEF toxin-antitoxin module